MHSSITSCCNVLGLVGEVTEATVKAAYRREMKEWHPDRHHADAERYAVAEQRAKDLNNAYEYLTEALEGRVSLGVVEEQGRAGSFSARATPRHVYRKRQFTPGFPGSAATEVFVKSSNILSVGYDTLRRVLFIKFHDGAVYEYYDVPPEIFSRLMDASSHGVFASQHIYHKFRQRRLMP